MVPVGTVSLFNGNDIEDRVAQLFQTLLEHIGIFLGWNNGIILCHDVHDRDTGIDNRLQVIDRVIRISQCLCFVGKPILFKHAFPFSLCSLPLSFSTWPALKVANGSIVVDTGNSLGVIFGPTVDIEPSPTDPFQGHFLIQSVLSGKQIIKLFPYCQSLWATQLRTSIDVGNVISIGEEQFINLCMISGETGPPNPRFSRPAYFGSTTKAACSPTLNSVLVYPFHFDFFPSNSAKVDTPANKRPKMNPFFIHSKICST